MMHAKIEIAGQSVSRILLRDILKLCQSQTHRLSIEALTVRDPLDRAIRHQRTY